MGLKEEILRGIYAYGYKQKGVILVFEGKTHVTIVRITVVSKNTDFCWMSSPKPRIISDREWAYCLKLGF